MSGTRVAVVAHQRKTLNDSLDELPGSTLSRDEPNKPPNDSLDELRRQRGPA